MNKHTKRIIITLSLFMITFSHALNAQVKYELDLSPGEKINQTLSDGESHIYTFRMENGAAIIGSLFAEELGLKVDVYHPNGVHYQELKSNRRSGKVIPFDITANQNGLYRMELRVIGDTKKDWRYSLMLEQLISVPANIKRITKKELPTKNLSDLWESSLEDKNAIDVFLDSQSEQHLIEPIEGDDENMLVTYFCVPYAHTEYVMLSGGPDFLGLRFKRLPNTKLHYVTQKVPVDARFNYGFNYFNLRRAGPNAEIELRDVEHVYDGLVEMPMASDQPHIVEREQVEKGELLFTAIQSEILHASRKITVHIPANYNPKSAHNLLIVFDGEAYGARPNRPGRVPTPTIMDNLLADQKISNTITVLVWSMGNRSKDLISEDFGDFIIKELVPWMRSNYNIHEGPDKIVLAGSSRGGFAASFIALRHSAVVGNVLSQSGSYWIKGTKDENHWIYPESNGKLIDEYIKSDPLPIKFYMDVGLYDAGASMLGMNRQFRDILRVKGYDVDYHEFKGGHSYANWRGTFADGLISLLGLE